LIVLMVGADSYEAWQDYQTAILRSETRSWRSRARQPSRLRQMVQEIDVVLADQAAAPDRLRADVTRFPFGIRWRCSTTTVACSRRRVRSARDVDYHERLFFSTLQRAAPGTLYIGKRPARTIGHLLGARFAGARCVRWRRWRA
jgi:hypothetical protein